MSATAGWIKQWRTRWTYIWNYTAPFNASYKNAIQSKWNSIPEAIKTPSQMLGQNTTGCEGTQGVFPKCNFSCTPCYHSKDANHVPIDREHTLHQIEAQMKLLREQLGDPVGGQHCQLIGGEVTLLGPQTHADALLLMQSYNRIPMSFTHGDFDKDYIQDLLKHGGGKITHLSFAGHFDTTMHGRRGIKKAKTEHELMPFRQRFCDMFSDAAKQFGITTFLAHNMTVTPRNVTDIPSVIESCRSMGWDMMSFQPAAYMGVPARWKETYTDINRNHGEYIWQQIEKGVGRPLPYQMIQTGDVRCNRTCWGIFVGNTYHPLLENESEIDRRWRDSFIQIGRKGGAIYDPKLHFLTLRFVRALLDEPISIFHLMAWALRLWWRCGPLQLLTQPVKRMTFVMHRFMNAEDVATAYDLSKKGIISKEPQIKETQERLQGCFYSMAHPNTGELVSACVQHSILDPIINRQLRESLGGTTPLVRRKKQSASF